MSEQATLKDLALKLCQEIRGNVGQLEYFLQCEQLSPAEVAEAVRGVLSRSVAEYQSAIMRGLVKGAGRATASSRVPEVPALRDPRQVHLWPEAE